MHRSVVQENRELEAVSSSEVESSPAADEGTDSGESTTDDVNAAAKKGGWRQRAAQKAMQLRTKADAAIKAANEQMAGYEIGAKVAAGIGQCLCLVFPLLS